MQSILKGMVAGFAATVVLSVLMVMKSMMGVMPDLDVARMLGRMMGAGTDMGWVAHFAIGMIAWGGLFALIHDKLPGRSPSRQGVVFGAGAWLMMMVAVMPMAGRGLFGLALGAMAPVMTLVLHVIFGAVLGWSYGLLTRSAAGQSVARHMQA